VSPSDAADSTQHMTINEMRKFLGLSPMDDSETHPVGEWTGIIKDLKKRVANRKSFQHLTLVMWGEIES
jgi:hypothetical protein